MATVEPPQWLGRPCISALGVLFRNRVAQSAACSGKMPLPQPLCPVQHGARDQWGKDQAPGAVLFLSWDHGITFRTCRLPWLQMTYDLHMSGPPWLDLVQDL